MTSVSGHCDNILAHLDDPAGVPPRFDVLGDVGTGKTTLLDCLRERCRARGLLVLSVPDCEFNSDKGPVLANVDACSKLIEEFFKSIELFQRQHSEAAEADSCASRAKEALGRIRSPNMLYRLAAPADSAAGPTVSISIGALTSSIVIGNLTVLPGDAITQHELLTALQHATEEALRVLAEGHELAILVDNVHALDGSAAHDWLRAVLRHSPTRLTVTTRHPGSRSWHQDQAERIIKLENMSLGEVAAYVREKGLAWTDEDVRGLFGYTRGHGWAVAAWCGLALDGGAARFADLVAPGRETVFDGNFTRLVEKVQAAIDQIGVKVLGYQIPLSGLLAISERVTSGLIATLAGSGGQRPSGNEAREIYNLLADPDRALLSVGVRATEGIRLHRAIAAPLWQRVKDQPERFAELQSAAEQYECDGVDLDLELRPQDKEDPFAAWTRFEQPTWVQGVERWLGHTQWLGPEQFASRKAALLKVYLDAFWWWDDYFRSKATKDLGDALRKVSHVHDDPSWMHNLDQFSEYWVASWDEEQLRADRRRWRPVLDAIIALLDEFNLEPREPARVPADLTRRRSYILLRIFYAKALWYSGNATRAQAEKADAWLAAAFGACQTQPGDEAENPNGWIGSWVLLRRAEIWANLDRPRAIGYLVGLDRQAIEDKDDDVRLNTGMLIGDLWWQSGDYEQALTVYSQTLLLGCAYNVKQENKRKAANLYTKSLYESSVRHVERKIAILPLEGDPRLLDTALADVKRLFQPYWDRVSERPDPSRFKLPVPPAWPGDILQKDTEHFRDLASLVTERAANISAPVEPPPLTAG